MGSAAKRVMLTVWNVARVSCKSIKRFLQEFRRVSCKGFFEECLARASSKSAWKSVSPVCVSRVSLTSVPQECLLGLFLKGVFQECSAPHMRALKGCIRFRGFCQVFSQYILQAW